MYFYSKLQRTESECLRMNSGNSKVRNTVMSQNYRDDYNIGNTDGHILFEALPNTRDLGGIPMYDGRRIEPKRLIRSGTLARATKKRYFVAEGRI